MTRHFNGSRAWPSTLRRSWDASLKDSSTWPTSRSCNQDTFGDAYDTTVPDYQPVSASHGFSVDCWSTHANYSHADPQTPPPGYLWLRTFDVHLPFTATLIVHFPHEAKLSIMNAASPVSARQTRLFAPIAKNFDTDQPEAEVQEFNRRIFEEDRAVVELQRPESLPMDPRIEVNIAADRSSVAYRRGLRGCLYVFGQAACGVRGW